MYVRREGDVFHFLTMGSETRMDMSVEYFAITERFSS